MEYEEQKKKFQDDLEVLLSYDTNEGRKDMIRELATIISPMPEGCYCLGETLRSFVGKHEGSIMRVIYSDVYHTTYEYYIEHLRMNLKYTKDNMFGPVLRHLGRVMHNNM